MVELANEELLLLVSITVMKHALGSWVSLVFMICSIKRVRNCAFLVTSATRNQVLVTRISQVVASMQLTLAPLTMMSRESD